MAEEPLMAVARARELFRGILRVTECRSRHAGGRMSFQINVAVAQQRKNRMVKRRRRQLDLAARRGLAILRNYPSQDLELHVAQRGLVGFAESALLQIGRASCRGREGA